MLTYALALLIGLGPALPQVATRTADATRRASVLPQEDEGAAPTYRAEAREVSNWRDETVGRLHPWPLAAAAVALGAERPVVTRCVKLNNYWCIKSARWNGEIGTDDEGHVGFASAAFGARAAATLLKRYYLELDRKSALAIVSRWAPAECRTSSPTATLPNLAVAGLGTTLRARWLASQRGASRSRMSVVFDPVTPAARALPKPGARTPATTPPRAKPPVRAAAMRGPVRSRVSAVPLRPLPNFRVPDIAAGMGEKPRPPVRVEAAARSARAGRPAPAPAAANARRRAASALVASRPAPVRVASAEAVPSIAFPTIGIAAAAPTTTGSIAPTLPTAATPIVPRPLVACVPDEQRIRNYAARIVSGLGLGVEDDLKLFDAEGRPLPNLEAVMLAMSAVELGALRADVGLVEKAVESLDPPPAVAAEPTRTEAARGGAAPGE